MEFRILKNYPHYRIYEDGTVVRMEHKSAKGSLLSEKEIKGHMERNKYLILILHDKNGNRKRFYLHRLVYEAFFGEIPEGFEIDHINGKREDCSVQNLRLATHKGNCNNPESIRNYRVSNSLESGKYNRERMYEGLFKTTDDMIGQTYLRLLNERGDVSIKELMDAAHCGYPRAKRIMSELPNIQ